MRSGPRPPRRRSFRDSATDARERQVDSGSHALRRTDAVPNREGRPRAGMSMSRSSETEASDNAADELAVRPPSKELWRCPLGRASAPFFCCQGGALSVDCRRGFARLSPAQIDDALVWLAKSLCCSNSVVAASTGRFRDTHGVGRVGGTARDRCGDEDRQLVVG